MKCAMKKNKAEMWNELHECSVAQLCSTLCDPMDCSTPGFSVHDISWPRTLERVPSPGDLSNLVIEPMSLVSPALKGSIFIYIYQVHEVFIHREEAAERGWRWSSRQGRKKCHYTGQCMRSESALLRPWKLRKFSCLQFSQQSSAVDGFTYSSSSDIWTKGSKTPSPSLSISLCTTTLSPIFMRTIDLDQ